MNTTSTIENLLQKIRQHPETVAFSTVMDTIAQHYEYTPAGFSNGVGKDMLTSAAGTNEGSCKIFAFARLHELSREQTLACFGDYYRLDVLNNPHGTDHANIRNFMKYGPEGIVFDRFPLIPR